jgi:addiction module RelE/StbE family toxin
MVVKWTRTALSNLAAIVAYIEENNAVHARAFAREIQVKTNSLVRFPGIGRPGRVIGTREMVIHRNYIIPYRVRGDVVEILRVLHVARRWPRQF